MKKVLVIAPYAYLPYFSGGQKFIAQFLHHLGKETDLTVISVAENDFSLARHYKTIPLLTKTFSRYYDWSLVKKITSIVKKGGFDTIIWEHPYYAWLAFRIRKRTGIKTIIHTHNIEHQRFRSMGKWWWTLLKWYEKRCFLKADGIFFITPEDMNFAISQWNVPESKCLVLPFGVDINQYPADRARCKAEVSRRHNIPQNEKILLFTGLLNYKPNLDALKAILDKLNPILLKETGFYYKTLICGKGLPEGMNELKGYANSNIIFTGFVTDVDTYYKSADIFLNPVQSGGGIKTKLVEAIAYGTTVVSMTKGAAGIDRKSADGKLLVAGDDDWQDFAKKIIMVAASGQQETPSAYYEKYNWDNIIKNLLQKTGPLS